MSVMRIALVVTLGACGTATQSARTLPKGDAQVTLTTGRTMVDGDDIDESAWSGNLSVRYGLGERFDAGLHVGRTPSSSSSLALYAIDPKLLVFSDELSDDEWNSWSESRRAVSLALPIGVVVRDRLDTMDLRALFVAPTIFLGWQAAPNVEVIFAPKLVMTLPDDEGLGRRTLFNPGASFGARFTDAARSWAIHPEIGYLRFAEGDRETHVLTFGVGLSAGN